MLFQKNPINQEVMRIRDQDMPEVIRLSEYAFQYKTDEKMYNQKVEKYNEHLIFAIYDHHKLASKLHIINHTIFLGNKEWKMGGIASVATYPEYRRQGYVKKLITYALREMKQNGQSISFLHPFSIGFYRKFGWEILNYQQKIRITNAQLLRMERTEGKIQRLDHSTFSEEMNQVYEQYTQKRSGMLKREKQWWKEAVVANQQVALYVTRDNVSSGYIIYQISNKKMVINEMVTLTEEAIRGLWNFICQHDSMIEEVTIVTSSFERYPFYLSDPNVECLQFPYFMARIVDVLFFLREYPFLSVDGQIALVITDSLAPWNNGVFILENGKVEKLEVTTCEQAIELNIGQLTAILMGSTSVEELDFFGIIRGNGEDLAKFTEMLPQVKPAFYDFF